LDRVIDPAFLPDVFLFLFADFFEDLVAMVICLPQETRLLDFSSKARTLAHNVNRTTQKNRVGQTPIGRCIGRSTICVISPEIMSGTRDQNRPKQARFRVSYFLLVHVVRN
jgi:hypothetical protein